MKKYIVLLSLTAIILFALLYADHLLQSRKIPHINTPQENINEVKAVEKNTNTSVRVPILMYHSIDYGDSSLYVSKQSFQNHIDYFVNNNYNFINFENLKDNNIPSNPILLTFDDGYESLYENAFPILLNNNVKATIFVISDKINTTGYLNTSQITEMNNLISFQSHSTSHSDLTSLDEDSLENELKNSKEQIQSLVSNNVIAVSYPSGKFNSLVANISSKYYDYGITTKNGIYNLTQDKLRIPRIRVSKNDSIEYIIKSSEKK